MRQVKHIVELWDPRPVRRAGATMERAGGAKSARWLSEETAMLGQGISPKILAKLDSGYRSRALNMIELLVLTAAPNMPPVLSKLLGHTVPFKQVVDWFSGRGQLPSGSGDENKVGPWNLGIELVRAAERHSGADRNMRPAQAMSEEAPIGAEILRDMEQLLLEFAVRINERRDELLEEN